MSVFNMQNLWLFGIVNKGRTGVLDGRKFWQDLTIFAPNCTSWSDEVPFLRAKLLKTHHLRHVETMHLANLDKIAHKICKILHHVLGKTRNLPRVGTLCTTVP